ncbi:MAG: AcrB/AcrD/AcrF family protein, partial [Cyanobacteria bacterium RYN_339]|nr:AcrB/AcrD/AcrF family protein [Cyanobacteria bacterium RYN_339]
MEQHGGGFNVSAWAIKNPVPIILLWVTLCIFGIGSYMGLGINDRPDVDFPLVVVSVARPGSSATELETDVTKKVEDSLSGIAHVEHINSSVQEGSSTTTLQLEIGTSSETALSDVRDAISRIRQSLPADINEPLIMHPNTSGLPFLSYSVSSSTHSVAELSRLVDEDISRALLAVPGVSEVQRSGGLTRQVRVTLDPGRLQALGTTVENVNLQLRALNLNLPGGQAKLDEGTQGIRTLGAARTVEELKAAPIILGLGNTARLDTLGKVEDAYAEVTQLARLDGKPVVSFSVVRTSGQPLVQTEAAAVTAIEALQKRLPADIHLDLIKSMGPGTRATFHASLDALGLGAFLAVVVIFIFLRQWQATIIAGLAIPLSILPTFAVMKIFGYSLNFITLLGLTLVVGILVDDAIVDLENIERHIRMGKNRMLAAIEATSEIGLAVVATTMTIVAVFVPVSFMSGIMGLFFKPFGVTVAVAVLFSLLVARTATPLMAAYLLPEHVEAQREPAYRAFYLRMLGKAISHRWIAMFVAAAVFVGSLATIPFIGKGFFSAADESEVSVNVSLPSGSSIEATEQVVQQLTRQLQHHVGVRHVFATVGSAVSNLFQPGSSGVSNATVSVLLVRPKERNFTAEQFANEIRPLVKQVPGARIDVTATGGVGSAKPVNLILRGEDHEELFRIADKVTAEMRGLSMLKDVQNTAAELRPEVHVRPDFQRAAEQGVSVQAIGRAVRLATQGEATLNLPKFNAGDQQIDILVTLNNQVQRTMADIDSIRVNGVRGQVPLNAVADVSRGLGPVSISRADRMRQVTFTANLASGDLGSAMTAVYNLPTMKHLPATVSFDTSGQAKFQADAFSAFGVALGTGVMFIYMVLVLLFGNFLQPITIMMALPLSFAGAFLGLLLFGKEMGLMALIGIVMLMGLVTKNSILLVDHTLEGRKRGLSRHDALIDSGRDRVRPILMTTIAMITG